MTFQTRTVEAISGDELPTLAIGTYELHGVTFLRADHLVHWLDEIAAAAAGYDPLMLVDEIRARLADAGNVRA